MALIKPIGALTRDDLDDFPLWEFVPDDEAGRVRPVASAAVPEDGLYHVACDVETASGRRLLGHLRVRDGRVVDGEPTVVGDEPGGLALEAAQFPLEWQLRVPLAGEGALRAGTHGLAPVRH